MDKLRSMAVFVAVVEAGSFTQAAVRLEISAVMVGKYIAQLENSLATRLLARNTRRQSLTDAGRVFYEEARRVLEQVHIAETSVERLRAAPAGTLRVTASTTFGGCVIAPITATFLTAWPQVRVDLDLSNRSVDLLEEGFDLAIRIGAVNSEDVVVKPLCLYRMVICAAPAYLARYGEPASPEALRDHRCLTNGVWNRRNEWKLPGEAGEISWQRDPVLRCNDGQGLRMAAIAGAGLLLQPEILVREELANGTLVRIMQPFTPRPRPVNLVYRQESRPLPKLTHYIEHLHHEITQWVAA